MTTVTFGTSVPVLSQVGTLNFSAMFPVHSAPAECSNCRRAFGPQTSGAYIAPVSLVTDVVTSVMCAVCADAYHGHGARPFTGAEWQELPTLGLNYVYIPRQMRVGASSPDTPYGLSCELIYG